MREKFIQKLKKYNNCRTKSRKSKFLIEKFKKIIEESVKISSSDCYAKDSWKINNNSYLIDKIKYIENIGFSDYLIDKDR